MGLFTDDRKVKAAARSMHQFLPEMRGLFPEAVQDWVVEASLVFMYRRMCHEVYGHRFVERWDGHVHDLYKYATAPEVNAQILKVAKLAESYEGVDDTLLPDDAVVTDYEHRIRCMIRAIFNGAGCPGDDPEIIRSSFAPVESLMKKIASHLAGIKKQNPFVMR